MSRLRHSFSAYRRRMQMSRATLFVLIEGHKDSFVYSKIADIECSGRGIDYHVATAEEISNGAGGKEALLAFFDYLRRKSSLIDKFEGKTTVSIFFLDKDIDDFLRRKRRCEHVVYTETYELENYLFMHGDLSEAAAASASLAIKLIRDGISDCSEWRRRAAENWKKWVILCFFARTNGLGSIPNYRLARSPINDGAYGEVKKDEYRNHLSRLQRESGLAPDEFKSSFARLGQRVNRIYSSGQQDRVFKGKWYACFLAQDIRRIANRRRVDCTRLERTLVTNLAQTLNFDDDWAGHFRVPIRRLVAQAGI